MKVQFKWWEISIYVLYLSTILSWSCPHPKLLYPCECHHLDISVIICGGNIEIDLFSIFLRLSENIPRHVRHFGIFYLNNTAIRTLPANVFHGITFRHLYFDGAIRLQYIHPNAFLGTESYIEFVNAWNTNLDSYRVPNENDAFGRLNNLYYLDIASKMYCPNEDLIKPCYCKIEKFTIGSHSISMRNSYSIYCDRNEPYFIKQIFQRITTEEPIYGRHFDNLYLDNHFWTNYTEIPEDSFSGVTFSNLYLQSCGHCHNYKLVIHPKAFGKTKLFIQSLSFSTNIPSNSDQFRDTFVAVNSLPNLRHISINSGFETIPAHTFRSTAFSAFGQMNLKTISIKGRKLRHIESYAFYALSNLNFIDLSNNIIDKIDRHAFAFRQISTRSLLIDLRGNQLNSLSFESEALNHILRPMELILASNQSHCSQKFQYLEEEVFAPFFADNHQNTIELGPCPLVCDCNMKWLVKAPHYWKLQIKSSYGERAPYLRCTHQKSLFEMKYEDFGYCLPDCHISIWKMNVYASFMCKRNNYLNSIFR